MAAQSRATLPHHCPDRVREKTEHRGLYLLFLCLPSCPGRKERDTRRAEERKGKLERKREGERGRCLTAVNWRRLYPTNISEKEGEKRKRDFFSFYSQRGCLRVYISFLGGRGEKKTTFFGCLFTLISSRHFGEEERKESQCWDYFFNLCVWSRFRYLLGFRISSSETPGKRMSRSDLTPMCA